jgi:hypothetical protein
LSSARDYAAQQNGVAAAERLFARRVGMMPVTTSVTNPPK